MFDSWLLLIYYRKKSAVIDEFYTYFSNSLLHWADAHYDKKNWLISSSPFLFVLHFCQLIFHQLNWLRVAARPHVHKHVILSFLPSVPVVFIFFVSRTSFSVFSLGLPGVVVGAICWAPLSGFPISNNRVSNFHIHCTATRVE